MAIENFFEDFIMQDWTSQSDGFGGIIWTWKDGAQFKAGISMNSSTEMKIAEQQGLKTIFTVVTKKTLELEQGDVIKHKITNELYRITSNSRDMQTPAVAEVEYWQVSAEKVET